jgi:ABC-type Fe3+-hydroxamate transport system substrate-binding protein
LTHYRFETPRSDARGGDTSCPVIPVLAFPQSNADWSEALIALGKPLGRRATSEDLVARISAVPRTLEEGP